MNRRQVHVVFAFIDREDTREAGTDQRAYPIQRDLKNFLRPLRRVKGVRDLPDRQQFAESDVRRLGRGRHAFGVRARRHRRLPLASYRIHFFLGTVSVRTSTRWISTSGGVSRTFATVSATSSGLSFYFGCRHLAYVNSSLYSNAELLKIEAGHHPEIGTHVQLMAAASQGIRSALESNANRANRLGHMQFRFLIAGAVLYIGWHVLEMWLRTRA